MSFADSGNIWKFVLDEISDSGPFTIIATLEVESPHVLAMKNVLFGDVWICAGQFDMQFTLNDVRFITYSCCLWFGLMNMFMIY